MILHNLAQKILNSSDRFRRFQLKDVLSWPTVIADISDIAIAMYPSHISDNFFPVPGASSVVIKRVAERS